MRAAALSCLVALVSGAAGAACGPAELETAVVARVTAEGDILLSDGRTLALAGLHLPDGVRPEIGPGARVAFGALGEPDRWGRSPALVFRVAADGALVWAQADLLAAGRALARPGPGLGPCWPLLLAAEARAARRPDLPIEAGRFGWAEGRVARVGEGRSAVFLVLVDASGQRATAMIEKRRLGRLKRAGVDVQGLNGHILRVRGVRRSRDGRLIAVSEAEQIEIVR